MGIVKILSHHFLKLRRGNINKLSDLHHPCIQVRQKHNLYTSQEIREAFIKFYENDHQHKVIPSSKVYSTVDDSLLFVNAGMNQFKPIILGTPQEDDRFNQVRRAVNSQRCIRAGGKHNDLADVGVDLCHHTLFEMLGSWSFGDYFKDDACKMAWELLTEVFKLPVQRLYVTYFSGCDNLNLKPDLKTKEIWRTIGVPEERILPFGSDCNFWEMGDTGPCGPCTEIHYDQIENRYAPNEVNVDSSDIIEIWNLVFMQYNRIGADRLEMLDTYHVDTGMGLERITAVMQGKLSNYDTDLFQPIIGALEQVGDCRSYQGQIGSLDPHGIDAAYRIVSDHIRMLTVAIADGIFPGQRGRELIVRRVLQRAVKAGTEKLKIQRLFLGNLIPIVVDSLHSAYPELRDKQSHIIGIVNKAERSFYKLLDTGDRLLQETVDGMTSTDADFPGEVAIHLLSYLGYPRERFIATLKRHNISVNWPEIESFFREKHKKLQKITSLDGGTASESGNRNYAKIIQQLSALQIVKSEDISSLNMKRLENGECEFLPVSTKVSAIVSSEGNVTTEVHNTGTEDLCLLLNESICINPYGKQLSDVGYLLLQGKRYLIHEVINVQGWLLHYLSPGNSLPEIKVGENIEMCGTATTWLPFLRACTATEILKNTLPLIINNNLIQKVKVEQDKIRIEIAGSVPSSDVRKLEDVICAAINNTDSSQLDPNVNKISQPNQASCILHASDIKRFITIKHKHQGSGRTILHFLTGERASVADEQLEQIKTQVSRVLKEHEDMESPNLLEIKELRHKVGSLTYEVNQSEIHFFEKAGCRKKLEILSGRLHTMSRRLNKLNRNDVLKL